MHIAQVKEPVGDFRFRINYRPEVKMLEWEDTEIIGIQDAGVLKLQCDLARESVCCIF